MAAPNYSPSGGAGSTYRDPQTNINYTFKGNSWQPVSSGNRQAPMSYGTPQVNSSTPQIKSGSAPQSSNPQITQPSNNSQPSGGGDGINYDEELNKIYSSGLSAANEAESNVRSGYESDARNLEAQISQQQNEYGQKQTELLGATDQEESIFNKVLKQAVSDAIRSYQALDQQRKARFGGGTSAGGAVGELAQQEFFRQQGKVQEKGVEGQQQFASERGRIRTYITTQMEKLDLYKKQAMDELKKNLNSQLAEINARRGDIESNRARDRLSILQDSVNRARAIEASDKQFRQNLALAAVNQLQQISGTTFTPAEIKTYIEEFSSSLPGEVGVGAQQQGGGTDPRVLAAFNPNFGQKDDELQQVSYNTQAPTALQNPATARQNSFGNPLSSLLA